MPADTTFNPVATAVALVTANAGGDTDTDGDIIAELEPAQARQVIACLTGMLTAHARRVSQLLEIPFEQLLSRMGIGAADFDVDEPT